jgi:hypothetical protein
LAQCREQSRPGLFWEDVPYGTPISARQKVVLNRVEFHHIFPASIPHAVASLSIDLVWHNDEKDEVTLVAGSVGATVNEKEEKETLMHPRFGWWMVKDAQLSIEPK